MADSIIPVADHAVYGVPDEGHARISRHAVRKVGDTLAYGCLFPQLAVEARGRELYPLERSPRQVSCEEMRMLQLVSAHTAVVELVLRKDPTNRREALALRNGGVELRSNRGATRFWHVQEYEGTARRGLA